MRVCEDMADRNPSSNQFSELLSLSGEVRPLHSTSSCQRQHIGLLQAITGNSRLLQPSYSLMAYYIMFWRIPAYSGISQPILAYSSLFQSISAYSGLFHSIPFYSILFQALPAFSSLFCDLHQVIALVKIISKKMSHLGGTSLKIIPLIETPPRIPTAEWFLINWLLTILKEIIKLQKI